MVMANKMTEFMNQTMVVFERVEKKVDMLELSIGEIKMKQEQGAKERMTIYKQLEDMEVPPRRKRYDRKAKKACSYCGLHFSASNLSTHMKLCKPAIK